MSEISTLDALYKIAEQLQRLADLQQKANEKMDAMQEHSEAATQNLAEELRIANERGEELANRGRQ